MADIVERRGANHIFPETIPEKRKERDVFAKKMFGAFFIGMGTLLAGSKIKFLFTSVSYLFLLYVFAQVCLRICHLFEEYYHLKSRYEGDLFRMIKDTFSFDNNKIKIVIACAVVLFTGNPWNTIPVSVHHSDGIFPWALVFLGTYFLVTLMKLEECPLNTAKLMDQLQALDYGSGMAYSYFYGYLNLILPCTGDERKGLKEQIEDFASKHNVEFGSKKLYIFIPLSAYCPTSVAQNSNCMEVSDSLHWRIMDRAGVKERQYHNTVYKVWPRQEPNRSPRKPIYVCAEYATPLLTLHEVMDQNNDDSRRYKKYQKEIVTNFYLTLDKIIKNNRDCRDLAELIYYRDIDNNGEPFDRSQLDIGLLLLERINRDLRNE